MAHFNSRFKPGQAIGKATEYIKLDKKHLALKELKDVFKNKSKKSWTEDHEKAMFLLVETSISMRKNLRDDLQSYRYFTRDVQTRPTLMNVLNYAVGEAEEQINKAENREKDETEVVVDDESPESLIMKAVCGDETKDRINREVLTPWVRYLSECYRNALDCCLKNPDHEDTFHKLATKAFSFARRHKQKIAFKNNFCRLVREHWINMTLLSSTAQQERRVLVSAQQKEPSPNNKFNLMVTALLDQLDVAVSFDNWQEAYKAIEEIASRFEYFKVKPTPEIMIPYYTQLAQIFWVSRNWLFHAYALIKLFYTKRDQELIEKKKDKSDQKKAEIVAERQKLANKVVIATLCIPAWNQEKTTSITPFITDPQREKSMKMISLLGSTKPPSRESLLSDLNGKDACIFKLTSPEVQGLYNIVERNVQPLTLAEQVTPLFEWLGSNALGEYTEHLQLVSAVSVIVASSKVYSTLSLESLRHMCRFYETMDLESLLVSVARSPSAHVGLCIDHQSASIRFEDANISPDILSSTLPMLRKRLAKINRMLLADSQEGEVQHKKIVERQGLLLKRVVHGLDEERSAIIKRKDIIEEKKVKAEREAEQAKRAQVEKQEAEKTKQLNEEKKKVEEEKQRRMKLEEEEKNRKKTADQTQVVIKALKQSQIKTGAIEAKLNRGEKMDTDTLMEHGKKLMIEAKERAEQKRLKEWHNVHWLERACREMEAPMIRESHEKRLDNLKDAYETRKQNTVSQMKKDWEEAFAHKERMGRMESHMGPFFDQVLEARYADRKLIARAEKHVQDEDEERELMVKAGRSGGDIPQTGGSPSSPTSAPAAERKPNPAQEVDNWRGGGAQASSQPDVATPAAAGKPAFKARGPSINLSGDAPAAAPAPAAAAAPEAAAAPAAAAPAAAPAAKSWGGARKGGFKIDL
eukprot:TRINITY_DN2374_c0_g3_i1.p1 TRINITY_DN2374_c0_g3~~TRINITY_DN2374_c0_g3_i1.p1  ORF type:complete len:922 (+),score=362.79 TRINITY_DN2374_c0_g3_i1:39-2804(+)